MTDRSVTPQQKLDIITEIFATPNLKIQEIYERKNILSDIKYNLKRFIDQLKVRFELVKQMLDLIINIKESDLKDQKIRRYAYYTTQIINDDEETLIELFFYENSDSVSVQNLKHHYHILNYFMEYLLHQDLNNEGSNTYFAKTINLIIEAKPQKFLEFLHENQHFCDGFISNLRSPSIINTLAKIVTIENIQNHQKIQELGLRIFSALTEFILKNLEDEQIIENATIFLQQPFRVLRLNHKLIEMIFGQLKQLIRKLIKEFLNEFNNRQGNIGNIGFILRYLFEKKKQSEVFEKDEEFIHEFEQWFQNPIRFLYVIRESYFLSANNLSKIKYIDFLIEIVNGNTFKLNNTQISRILQTFVLAFQLKNEGLVKISLIQLFRLFSEKIQFNTIDNIQFLIEDLPKYLPNISNHLDLINLKMNSSICFQIFILLKFNEKLPELTEILNKKFQINLAQVIDIHNVKLGEMPTVPSEQPKIRTEVVEIINHPVNIQLIKPEPFNLFMKKTGSYQEQQPNREFHIKKTISIQSDDIIEQAPNNNPIEVSQPKKQEQINLNEQALTQIINNAPEIKHNISNNQNAIIVTHVNAQEKNKMQEIIIVPQSNTETEITNVVNLIQKQNTQQGKKTNINQTEKIKQQYKEKMNQQNKEIITIEQKKRSQKIQKNKNLSTQVSDQLLKFYNRSYKLI